MARKFAKSLFRRLAQFSRAICNGSLVRPRLGIIGARHSRVEVDLLILGKYTTRTRPCAFSIAVVAGSRRHGKGPQMFAAQQNAIPGKSIINGCGSNKRGELLRILSRVTELVYLARGGLDVQN